MEQGWPLALRRVPAYLPFRFVPRASGRLGKRPCSLTGQWVDPFDRRHHLSFEVALEALRRGAGDGLGVVLDGRLGVGGLPLVAVDLDDVVRGGLLSPAALELVTSMVSYAELSVSGAGVHVLAGGQLPAAGRRGNWRGLPVELITHGYVAITGNHLPDTPVGVIARPAEVSALHRALFPAVLSMSPARASPLACLGDEAIVKRARNARNGTRFAALYDGDLSAHGNDPSRADLAILSHLRWYTRDPEQLRRIWASSALYRPDRWARLATHDGQDYATVTISRALALGQPHFDPIRRTP